MLQRLGFSLQWFSCGAQAPGTRASVVEAHRLSDCGLQALELRLRRCGARCNCSAARGVFSDQGSNLFPLHWQTDSIHCTIREIPQCVFLSYGFPRVYMLSSGIGGSYGSSQLCFLKKLHTVLCSGCSEIVKTIYVFTSSIRGSIQHLLFVDFSMMAILSGVT